MPKTRLLPMALMALAGAAQAAPVELLTNGNFETGTFAGWTVTTRAGSSGAFNIDTPGTTVSPGGQGTAGNGAGGSFYAVSSQTGPGSYSLMQGFTVAPGATSVVLSFQMFANNWASATTVGAQGIDHNGAANQHARVDILAGGSGAFDLGSAVLQNLYIGADAGTDPNPYSTYSFDITSLVGAGGSFAIRFGQVDNQGFFNLGVDNVRIRAQLAAVPTPPALALSLLALGLMVATRRR